MTSFIAQVNDWYDWYELAHGNQQNTSKRSIFIATDEPSVIVEAKNRYEFFFEIFFWW